ncbi:MAG TPA: CHAT domain-containing protein [Blastocatellia bacterium]|nr:CHAT domain-containing protein [Blastocatellia bacterium]
MAGENQDHDLMRRYLLGQLAEDELQKFEEKMMADNELYNRVLLAEDEMVEEYLQGELSETERAGFEASFLSTAEGRRQVSFAKALSEYVSKTSASEGLSEVMDYEERIESVRVEPSRVEPSPAEPASITAEAAQGTAESPQLTDGVGQVSKVSRPAWWSRPALVPYFRLAAAAVIVLAVGLGTWRAYQNFRQPQISEGIASLRDAFRDQRPTQARISELNYAPPPPVTRGPGGDKFDYVALDRASLLIQLAANEHPSSRSYHELGLLYLAQRDFDKAIDQLRKAQQLAPNDARILSDIGGALFEKARSKGVSSAYDPLLDECLGSLNRALEINPSLAEAYFNRALCNELLMQWQSAEADWQAYLHLDSTSPWAGEAREGIRRIEEKKRTSFWNEQQLFDDFVAAAATQNESAGWRPLSISIGTRSSPIVERLIDQFLNRQAGDDNPTRLLRWAGKIAIAETSDRQITDIAERYERASTSDLARLKDARRLLIEGMALFRDWKLRDACHTFESAALQFENLGDHAEACNARYLEAHCYLRLPELEAAHDLFSDLETTARTKKYRWLQSRAGDGLAELYFSRNEYSRAIEFARRSLDLSRSLSNDAGIGRSCSQLTEIYLQLGDYSEGGKFAWEGLQAINKRPVDPLQSSLPYEAAADLYTAGQLPGLAMAFQLESLRRAEGLGYPVKTSFAHAHVGRLYAALDNQERAFQQIQLAREAAALLPDEEGADVRAFASLCAANLQRRAGDLDRAILSYQEALQCYAQSGRHNLAFASRMGKLLCHIKRRDTDEAKAEMALISSLIEQFTGEIVEEKNRILFTEGLEEFHDAAIDFAYSTLGAGNVAYQYAEMFRARSLYDLATGPWETTGDGEGLKVKTRSAPLTPEDITSQIPSSVQLVQFAVLDKRSFAWVVSGGGIQTREIPVTELELRDRVKRFVDLCRSPVVADVTPDATALYEILIQPIELLLDPEKQLCIVPDNVLSGLPFAALKSPRTNRYLIEDFAISGAPSSSLFVRCTDWARRKRSASAERVLSVGDPEFDQERFKLNRLPDAAREARAIARKYAAQTILIGPQASKAAVITAMSQSDVINLATHYLIDKRSPMLSKLLLSKEAALPGDSPAVGALYGYELYGLRLPRAKLVVLSGCQTIGDEFFNFEGAVGAARPFISAGVPLVVASLWPIDSSATADLVVEFHRLRKPGVSSSAKALQAAQLKMIRSDDFRKAPFYWAGFSLIGGYADF